MTVPTMDEALKRINDSIQRKKGSFELAQAPEGFALAAGSWRAVKVNGGFIVCIQLSKDQVEYLKGQCEAALAKDA
jgi:hypothetical protein